MQIYDRVSQPLPESQISKRSPSARPPIALVCMPWGPISRGSLALSILKQCAQKAGYPSDIHYLNIRFAERIGFKRYESISRASALSTEWFFSSVLFGPVGMGLIRNGWDDLLSMSEGKLLAEELKEVTGNSDHFCRSLVDTVIPQFIEDCLSSIDWAKYPVIGMSVTFAQTLASLLLAKHMKERYPDKLITFGGANVDSEMGFEILNGFNWIDYVVHGEAERSFPELLNNIFADRRFERIPGISFRHAGRVTSGFADTQSIKDLNESPVPDYTDYVREVERTGINKTLSIKLPFESSRGCWWGAKSHCTFCGLNGNTMAFRKKTPARVRDEMLLISSKYRSLNLYAVDNILDMGYFNELLPKLAEADLDLSVFYEVKANLNRAQVRNLAAAGIRKIQPGIESFNTELLQLMRKGVTAIQNIQLLKWCREDGIDPSWNILYGFPGEHASQYADYPKIFRLLYHLRPPSSLSRVIFERFSPYHFDREKFKLTLRPVPSYRMLYPEQSVNYEKLAYFFEGRWEGQEADPQEYIQPAMTAHQAWTNYWKANAVFFYYEKGPGFVTLYDNRPMDSQGELKIRKFNLNEIQSRVYLFCDENRSFGSIKKMLEDSKAGPTEEYIRGLLDQFVGLGLMFREGDRYLSLAVRKRAGYGQWSDARTLAE